MNYNLKASQLERINTLLNLLTQTSIEQNQSKNTRLILLERLFIELYTIIPETKRTTYEQQIEDLRNELNQNMKGNAKTHFMTKSNKLETKFRLLIETMINKKDQQ